MSEHTPAAFYERRYHLLVERFNALSKKREQLEQQLDEAMTLLKEFPGRYEDMLLYDHSLEDYYQRVTAFLEQRREPR